MAATASPVLGWKPMSVILVFGAFTIIYSLMAGLFAVAYNDVLQFVILIGGNLLFGFLLVSKAGGPSHVLTQVSAFRGQQFLSAVPGGSSLTGVTLLALCVQGLFFAGSPFAGEGWTAQRFMAARNERHAILGQMANGVLALAVRLIPFIVIALAAAALLPVNAVPVPASLWGDLVKRYAPPGLFGLLLVSSLAGYMAAISSIGNWAASYVINDVYKRSVRPQATQKEFVLVSRIATGVLLTVAFLWGGLIHPAQLDKWILFINSALIVFSLPLAWLKWFWWRTNAVGDMVGVLGGFPAGYLVWFGSDSVLPGGLRAELSRATGWNWNHIIPAFGDLERFPFWVGFAILFAMGWMAILAATLSTKPEPMHVLEDFYRSARPIGIWGPVRRSLASKGREPTVDNFGKDLSASAWGVVFYFSLCVGLFSAMGGRIAQACGEFATALVSGYFFARKAMARLSVSSD
jgi:Na+/proline symporter